MPEFKNQEEYHKWKAERGKQPQQNENKPKEIKQPEPVKTRSPYVENKSSKEKIFLIIGILLIVLIPAIYFLWSYMTHGKLSGNVYVTMKSGDIKKAAGIKIYLLKTEENPINIADEVERMQMEYFKLRSEVLDMEIQYYKEHKNLGGSLSFEDYFKGNKLASTSSEKLKNEYNQKTKDFLFSNLFKEVQTDINGYYEFLSIPYGRYILLARYTILDEKPEWLYPVEISSKENKIDLSNDKMKVVFF